MSGIICARECTCCYLLTQLEADLAVLDGEFLKVCLLEENHVEKKEKLEKISSDVYQKLSDLWYSASHMTENVDMRRVVQEFVTLTAKAWEKDYDKIERESIHERMDTAGSPFAAIVEKVRRSVAITDKKYRSSRVWDCVCHQRFSTIFVEILPKLGRLEAGHHIQCTMNVIEKATMVFNTIHENIVKFLDTLVNFHPSHFGVDTRDPTDPTPLSSFSRAIRVLTTDDLNNPQMQPMDLRLHPNVPEVSVFEASAPIRNAYRDPPEPNVRYAHAHWPPTMLPTHGNYNHLELPRVESYPFVHPPYFPYVRGPEHPFQAFADQGFNPYIGGMQFPHGFLPNQPNMHAMYGGQSYYPPIVPFPCYPPPYYGHHWDMDARMRQEMYAATPPVFMHGMQQPMAFFARLSEEDVVADATPINGFREGEKAPPPPMLRRKRKKKAKQVEKRDAKNAECQEAEVQKGEKEGDPKGEATDLQPIQVPKLLRNMLKPLN